VAAPGQAGGRRRLKLSGSKAVNIWLM